MYERMAGGRLTTVHSRRITRTDRRTKERERSWRSPSTRSTSSRIYSDVNRRTRLLNARSMARARGPSAWVEYETHIMVSGTTFIAQLPDGLVDVVIGQAGRMKRSRCLRPIL